MPWFEIKYIDIKETLERRIGSESQTNSDHEK